MTLTRRDEVFLLSLGEDENRFTPEAVVAINRSLDEVEAAPAPRALVTVATGKFWSNGLSLDWMMENPDQVADYVGSVQTMLGRVLTLPVPTVAAIQGHCFAAGAMLALAHDARVMRADRGYLCLPEVDIHIPFTAAMTKLFLAKMTPAVAHESMTTGRRYGGVDAQRAQLVDDAVAEAEVESTAIARAAALASKDGATLGAIKRGLYGGVADALAAPVENPLASVSA